MIPGLPATTHSLPPDAAADIFARAISQLSGMRGRLDRFDATDEVCARIAENFTTLGEERVESLCGFIDNLARAWDWPMTHDCADQDFDEDEGDLCRACIAEQRAREHAEIEGLAAMPVEPVDLGDDIAF